MALQRLGVLLGAFVLTFLLGPPAVVCAEEPPSAPADPPAAKPGRPPLTDEQRQQLEARVNGGWNTLSLHEKQQLLRFHRALKLMPADERRFIQDRLERFIHMTPEEKKRLQDNAEKWRQLTPEQRQKAREEFRRRRQEFEAQWRRDHPGEEPPPFPYHKKKPAPAPEGEPPAPAPQSEPKQ